MRVWVECVCVCVCVRVSSWVDASGGGLKSRCRRACDEALTRVETWKNGVLRGDHWVFPQLYHVHVLLHCKKLVW